LSEGDVRLPKLFRQTVPQRWPGGGKTAVTCKVTTRVFRSSYRLCFLAERTRNKAIPPEPFAESEPNNTS